MLVTERLILRELRSNDLDAIHAFGSDPEVTLHSSWGPNSIDETRAWLERVLDAQKVVPRATFEQVITLPDSGEVIGTGCLGITNFDLREAFVGYTFKKEAWGKGYATEFAIAMLNLAFGDMKLHRVYATTSPLNLPSQRVLEKIGMIREGLLRKNVLQRGTWRDSYLYAILEEDWRKLNSN